MTYFYFTVRFVNLIIHVCWVICGLVLGVPDGSDGKESACNVGDPGLIPGLGRSPSEEHGIALKFLPGESMDRGVWKTTVHGVAKSWTRLRN